MEALKSSQRSSSSQLSDNKIPVVAPVLAPEVLPIEVPMPEPLPSSVLSVVRADNSAGRPNPHNASYHHRLHVHVRCDLASFVIGKKGHRVKKLQDDHRVRIRSLKEAQRPGYVTFEICGASEESIKAASNDIVSIQSNVSRNAAGQRPKHKEVSSDLGSFEVIPGRPNSVPARERSISSSTSNSSVTASPLRRHSPSESSQPAVREPRPDAHNRPHNQPQDDGPSLATIAGIVVGGVAAVAAAAFASRSALSHRSESSNNARNQQRRYPEAMSAQSNASNDDGCVVC